MAHGIEDVQPGWKVFAGPEELGSVKEVKGDEIVVSKGGVLNKHEYHVPREYVEDAADGIVDLSVDRATVESNAG
jgi:hypothetical protein